MSDPNLPVPADASPDTNDRKPLYALAGAADAAVTALRELPARVSGALDDQRRAELRDRLRELPAELKADVDEARKADVKSQLAAWRDRFPDAVVQAQERVSEAPDRLRELASRAGRDAAGAYDEFAGRGEGAVSRWRDAYSPAVENAVAGIRARAAHAAESVADATARAADALATKRREN